MYRAIFLSSSEDESDSEKNTKPDNESYTENIKDDIESVKPFFSDVSLKSICQQTDNEVNILRNTSPPRGVFANLDLDAINSWTKKNNTTEDVCNKSLVETDKSKIITETEKAKTLGNNNKSHLLYGPSLPSVFPDKTRLSKTTKSQSSMDTDSDSEWVELKSQTKHKQKKKHSKKLHKKEKRHKSTRRHKHKKNKK